MKNKLPPITPIILEIDKLIEKAKQTQAEAEAAKKRLKELSEGKEQK